MTAFSESIGRFPPFVLSLSKDEWAACDKHGTQLEA